MEDHNHDETLLARWLSNELSEAELTTLQQREDYAQLAAIVKDLEALESPAFSEEDQWAKLQKKIKAEKESASMEKGEAAIVAIQPAIEKTPEAKPQVSDQAMEPVSPPVQQKEETPIKKMDRRQWLYAAAAVLALLIAAIVLFPEKPPIEQFTSHVATNVAEQKELSLPDGSVVMLNAASKIAFTPSDWPDERVVYLEGEAHFKAKKGKTFHVHTDQGIVRVVGTVFNVYARQTEMEVKCTEGTVQVFNPKSTEKVLVKAGEQVAVLNGKMQKRRGIDFSPKWFRGESRFKGANRQKVFEEIERQFDVTIIAPTGEASTFSGKFSHDDLEKAIKIVAVPMDLDYTIVADTIRFVKK